MKNNKQNDFFWCFNIGDKVTGSFYEEVTDLKFDDEFIVQNRTLDEENNQYFDLLCIRNNKLYEVPASLID